MKFRVIVTYDIEKEEEL